MLGHSSGIIGLPLRLLAREVYNSAWSGSAPMRWRLTARRSQAREPALLVATVEAMPRELDLRSFAIDECSSAPISSAAMFH